MYKWPQGRVIRIICLILAAVVCADLAWNGGYAQYAAWSEQGILRQAILAGTFAVLAAAVVVTGLVLVGFHKRAVDFLIEVEQEMVRVEWPKTDVLWKSTLVIAATLVVMSAVIFGVDVVFVLLVQKLRNLGGYF